MDTDSSYLFPADAAHNMYQQPLREKDNLVSLDQLSDEDFWRRAQTLARQDSLPVGAREYLECELSRFRCLLPLDALSEVCLPPDHYACLPALPWWACGLVAWHGEVIVVVDLDQYLSAQAIQLSGQGQVECSEATPAGMLLVALDQAIPIGLHVRSIGRTRAVDPDATISGETHIAAWIDPSRAALVVGTLDDAVILDLPVLLESVMSAINREATGAMDATGAVNRPPTWIEAGTDDG